MRKRRDGNRGLVDYISDHFPKHLTADSCSLDDIINGCRAGEKDGWGALFAQKVEGIAWRIKKAFYDVRRTDLANNQETVQDVILDVVEKLLKRPLPDYIDSLNINSYLMGVAYSQTMEWMRKQKREFDVITGQKHTIALDAPVAGNDGCDSGQTIKDLAKGDDPEENGRGEEVARLVEKLLSEKSRLTKDELLQLKIFVMFYRDLEHEDLVAIAEKRGLNVQEIESEVAVLKELMLKQEKERIKSEDLSSIAFYMAQRAEERLIKLREEDSTDTANINEWNAKLDKARRSYKRHLNEARAIVRPTNEQVCLLLGLNASDEKYNTPQKLDRAIRWMLGCHKPKGKGKYGREYAKES